MEREEKSLEDFQCVEVIALTIEAVLELMDGRPDADPPPSGG
jgi:hypothetical protein